MPNFQVTFHCLLAQRAAQLATVCTEVDKELGLPNTARYLKRLAFLHEADSQGFTEHAWSDIGAHR